MEHKDHVYLLHDGIPDPGGVWADLAPAGGPSPWPWLTFWAPEGEIYSVDKDPRLAQRAGARHGLHVPSD